MTVTWLAGLYLAWAGRRYLSPWFYAKFLLDVIQQGDVVVVEGTTNGTTATGVDWRAGVTHAGRWCDVFEIRDFKIQRCYVYPDPDYASCGYGAVSTVTQ